MSPMDRSKSALPSNIRETLEASNLPIEVATAIADLCELRRAPLGWKLIPIDPTINMLSVLRNSEWPGDWERGKKMQHRLGMEVVPPECNIEVAAGQYERLLETAPQLPQSHRSSEDK